MLVTKIMAGLVSKPLAGKKMDNEGIINRSGFPLQIALENLIGTDRKHNDWSVIYTEHAWKNTNDSGFIDLILELDGGNLVLVVECKRVLDASWLFLNSKGKLNKRKQTKAWVSRMVDEKFKFFNWLDLAIDPVSPECEYSIVLGQDAKSKPMLERTAATLVVSTEAFAKEEARLFDSVHNTRIYFNVIVTTAKLNVCEFEPGNISLTDGTIKDSVFTEVPFLRFRKQLQQDIEFSIPNNFTYSTMARAKENSVFIVNAEHIKQFLCAFDPGRLLEIA